MMHRLPLLVLLGAGLLSCGGGAPDVEARRTALQQQRSQLMIQFADAQNRVRNTQTQALEHPDVAPLRQHFYDLLRREMTEVEPGADTLLDRALELGARIDELSRPQVVSPGQEPADSIDRGAVMREFAALEQTLQPLQARAMADPEVSAAFEAMQDSVHALMVRLNPGAETALEQMRRTSAAVDSIDAELRALGG